MVTNYSQYIKESTYVDYFQLLYDSAPKSLKKIIDSTKSIEQNPIWHMEGNVFTHIRLVTNRLGNAYHNDINLLLAGFFHDLGKVDTTEWDNVKGSWTARGHEDISVQYVDEYKIWIKEQGGDISVIKNIVQNHMRIKYIDEFRLQNKIELIENPNLKDILKFNSADYGGTELGVKPLHDLSELYKEIEYYKKRQEINKMINTKFNGNLIMQLYPHLKGKELGDVITSFKKHIENKFNIDFNEFVLYNNKNFIFNQFDLFLK